MANNKTKIVIAVIFLFLFTATSVFASGESFPTYEHTPEDLSQLQYLVGTDFTALDTSNQIISENLTVEYLYPLYKKMMGDPVSIQTKNLLYQDFLINSSSLPDYDSSGDNTPIDLAVKSWKEARKKILNNDVEIDNFGNCYPSAFSNAVVTLNDRQKTYTKNQLIEWVKNQDEVFAQCKYQPNIITESTGPNNVSFFKKVGNFFIGIFNFILRKNNAVEKQTSDACDAGKCDLKIKYDGQLQFDYEYQQAAFQYYAGNGILAEKFFTAISQNPKHPWGAYAAFSLGRLYINEYQNLTKYSYADEDKKVKDTKLANADVFLTKAEKQLKEVLANPKYAEMHKASQELLDYILGQRDPFALFKKSENILETSHDSEELQKAMSDFGNIWEQNNNDEFDNKILTSGGDLSQWINIWKNYKPENLDFVKKKYEETKSQPWLVALVRYLPVDDQSFGQIEQKINAIPETSLAYWTAHYYLIQKTINHGDVDKAKNMIGKLSNRQKSSSVYDYVENLKMQTSNSVNELFSHSQRYMYEIAGVYSTKKQNDDISKILFLDNKAKAIFETMLPIEKQVDLVLADNIFSKKQVEFLRLVTFVRALLLKDFNSAQNVAVALAKNNTSIGNDLSRFINAKTDEDKNYAGVVFMLHYPGIGIYTYDDVLIDKSLDESGYLHPRGDYKEVSDYSDQRWSYCQPTDYVFDSTANQGVDGGDYKEILTDTIHTGYNIDFAKNIISGNDRQKAKDQLQKIYNNAPANYFAKTVMDYAKSHPNEKSIPEALYFVVRATKLDCGVDKETTVYSKKAFQMLHSKYPNSEWTKNTPYYY